MVEFSRCFGLELLYQNQFRFKAIVSVKAITIGLMPRVLLLAWLMLFSPNFN